MIRSGLVRFHPDTKQSGDGFWKEIKKTGPTVLHYVLTEMAMEGIKGLGKGGTVNWKGGLAGVKRGAKHAIKHKVQQEIQTSHKKTFLMHESHLLEMRQTHSSHHEWSDETKSV